MLGFCLTSAEYNGLCFASARTLSKSAKRLSHISLSHPRQPYNSSSKQTLTTVFEPCTSVLFCWTLWVTVGQDTKLPLPPKNFFFLSLFFLPEHTARNTSTQHTQQLSNPTTHKPATHNSAINTPATMGLNHYRKLRARFNEYIYRDEFISKNPYETQAPEGL
jgi:hypothetical protein